jgi:hypothetical protein
MENQICARCGKMSDTKLPLCSPCRESLADFNALVEYLNSFTGSKEDLLWIIGSELSNRESSIINHVRVVNDPAQGGLIMIPIEPSSSTLKTKPWLKRKYEHIKSTINEISKLRRALGIAKQYYGAA